MRNRQMCPVRYLVLAGWIVFAQLASADAHHPKGVNYKIFQFSEAAIPTIDGDPSDWNVVPDSYMIDGSHLMDTVMGKGTNLDPEDLAVEVRVGWSSETNRLYFLYKMYDDMHNFNFERGDIFEVENPALLPNVAETFKDNLCWTSYSKRYVRYLVNLLGSMVTPRPGVVGTCTTPSRTGNGSAKISSFV